MHTLISIENYVQSTTNKEDGKMFFTNRQYRQNKLMRGQYRDAALLFCLSYWPETLQYTKKCFVYGKISY